jgi:hypothetical protein
VAAPARQATAAEAFPGVGRHPDRLARRAEPVPVVHEVPRLPRRDAATCAALQAAV